MTRITISFAVSDEDDDLIDQVLDRCEAENITLSKDRMGHIMDLSACIANGCPLDLELMLEWPNKFDVAHDIWGINRHIDHNTGRLLDCFLPRFYKEVTA